MKTNGKDTLEKASRFFHRRQKERMKSGITSSVAGQESIRLNPTFDEWHQGLPLGLTGSEPLETPFALWQQRMRSALLQLTCRTKRERDAV